MIRVHLVQSHRWLFEQLTTHSDARSEFLLVGADEEPDVVIFPVPPWFEGPQPEKVRPSLLSRIFLFSQGDTALPWAPGLFTSARGPAPRGVAGGFYIHPQQVEVGGLGELLDRQLGSRTSALWSFHGSVDTNPALRSQIIALDRADADIMDTSGWASPDSGPSEMRRHRFAASIGGASFVVCPAGFGPSSHRIFEAMRAGRVPVVIADEWVPPSGVDWDSCSIRLSESDVARLPSLLAEREKDAAQLGTAARAAWEEHFSPSAWLRTIVRTSAQLNDTVNRKDRLTLFGRAMTTREFGRRTLERAQQDAAAARRPAERLGNVDHRVRRRFRPSATKGTKTASFGRVDRLQIDVHIASFNTAAATELTLRALRTQRGMRFSTFVGDGGSIDGSRDLLSQFAERGWIHADLREKPRSHSDWLDEWLDTSSADVLVFCDSDVELIHPHTLRMLVEAMVRSQSAMVCAEFSGEARHVTEPVSGRVVRSMPRPSPWLMAVSPVAVADVGRSFAFRAELNDRVPEGCLAYDTAAYWFQRFEELDLRWTSMPGSYTTFFRHYQGLSWRASNQRGGVGHTLERSLERLRRDQG